MTIPQHDSDAGRPRDISPDGTHVRMSVARFASLVVGLCVGAGTIAGIYWSLNAHTTNRHIHIPEDFERDHGAPVGTRDLELSKESTAQALDTIVKVHLDEFAKTMNASKGRR